MNVKLAEKILIELSKAGVTDICLCAGARNAPFAFLLSQSEGFSIHHFFEERSAAFFALGKIQATSKPVALLTTSGTATAEALPAIIEAYYTAAPLIVVSADRPKRYRNSGSPQSIEQKEIFGVYVESCLDWDRDTKEISLEIWSKEAPLHINICFEEPLIDQTIQKIKFEDVKTISSFDHVTDACAVQKNKDDIDILDLDRPLVILGAIPARFRKDVEDFLSQLKAPIYAETLSGLSGSKQLAAYFLRGNEKSVSKLFKKKYLNSILRIGGVPTLRFWRDLEDSFQNIQVENICEARFTGLSRISKKPLKLSEIKKIKLNLIHSTSSEWQNLFFEDGKVHSQIQQLIEKYPRSEVAIIRKLSLILEGQNLYLGNSLPIREWDLAADRSKICRDVFGNRGANGIDGQISTFLGWSIAEAENWALLGDLTSLYDLSGPWISKEMKKERCRLVIINNGGGQIFNNMFKNEFFLNRHSVRFDHWAQMWGWEYQSWNEVPNKFIFESQKTVIELFPEESQSQAFWKDYSQI